MRRAPRVKLANPGALVRKASALIAAPSRRTFPAWIDASERDVAFPASGVTQRVRDGLVLRLVVCRKNPVVARKPSDGPGAR